MAFELNPRFKELAGKAAVGMASEEELLELKSLKKEVRKEIKVISKSDPAFLIKAIDKRIAKLETLKAYINEHGTLPEKAEKPEGTGKRGRPRKEEVVVA